MSTHIVGEHDRSVESLLGQRGDIVTNTPDDGPETVIRDGYVYVKNPILCTWTKVGPALDDDGPGGGRGSSSAWSGTYVNDALTAAGQAIQSFLTGQSLGDARKLAAAEQFQSMAQWALPPGVQPPGFEEGGAMQQLAALAGREFYTPPPNERRTVDPAALEQAAQVPPEIMDFIDRMLDTADRGRVVVTGGSSSN